MDLDLIILLRFAERLLAVGIGGMSIYLGYRLFLLVPEAKHGDGRITLSKDSGIVLSRIGPGVFFALFGAIAVGVALREGVQGLHTVVDQKEGATITSSFSGAGGPNNESEQHSRADQRMLLRREIAILNTVPKLLDPALPVHDRAQIEQAIPRIKLALMKPVWGDPAQGWGTPEALEIWLAKDPDGEVPEAIIEAVRYFNYPSGEDSP